MKISPNRNLQETNYNNEFMKSNNIQFMINMNTFEGLFGEDIGDT